MEDPRRPNPEQVLQDVRAQLQKQPKKSILRQPSTAVHTDVVKPTEAVSFDDQALRNWDATRGTRQKIEEPKTPWISGSDDADGTEEDGDESEIEDDQTKKQARAIRHIGKQTSNTGAKVRKLSTSPDRGNKDKTDRGHDAAPDKLDLQVPAVEGDDEDAAEQAAQRKKKEEFERKRRMHYLGEFHKTAQ